MNGQSDGRAERGIGGGFVGRTTTLRESPWRARTPLWNGRNLCSAVEAALVETPRLTNQWCECAHPSSADDGFLVGPGDYGRALQGFRARGAERSGGAGGQVNGQSDGRAERGIGGGFVGRTTTLRRAGEVGVADGGGLDRRRWGEELRFNLRKVWPRGWRRGWGGWIGGGERRN